MTSKSHKKSGEHQVVLPEGKPDEALVRRLKTIFDGAQNEKQNHKHWVDLVRKLYNKVCCACILNFYSLCV
jgi:hypothetical protein